MSNKDVAAKFGLPNNTLSTWAKNKEKFLDSLEKGCNIKWQKLRTGNFEMVDKAIFDWFLSMLSQIVPVSAAMIQEKAFTFAKELNVGNFQALNGWLRRWKNGNLIAFKTASGESKYVTPEMVGGWLETSLLIHLSNYELFTTLTNLDYSMNAFQIKPISLNMKKALADS